MTEICTNHPGVHDGIESCSRCNKPYCADCLTSAEGRRVCAVCKQALRDSSSQYLELRLATITTRAFAFLLDTGVMTILFWTGLFMTGQWNEYLQLVTSRQQGAGALVPLLAAIHNPAVLKYLIPSVLGSLALEAIFLQWRSQSIGKILMRVKVVGADGSRLTAAQAWQRTIARLFLGLLGPLAYVDYLVVFVGNMKATIHDRIASTRVVRE